MISSDKPLSEMSLDYLAGHVCALEYAHDLLGKVAEEVQELDAKTVAYRAQAEIKLAMDLHRMGYARKLRDTNAG